MEDIKLGLAPLAAPPEAERAEALLHDIATMLLRLPMHGHVQQLHLRALRLKQRVSGWSGQVPDATVQDTIGELVELDREARDVGRLRLAARCATTSLVP
jgi:hypothetical protein